MAVIEAIKTFLNIMLLVMAALYIGVVVLYAAGVIIGIWTVFNGQITVGLGLIAMCGFLLWAFVYLPADMSRSWSKNCWS